MFMKVFSEELIERTYLEYVRGTEEIFSLWINVSNREGDTIQWDAHFES